MKRNHVTIRQIDRQNLKQEFELFKELYNAAWEKNWSFVPMTEKELDALVKSLGQFFDPDLAFFGYVDGEPAGFIMAIPDFNQVLLKAYAKPGTPEVVTLLKAAYYWKINPIMDWARVPLMGVKEAYRSKGVDAVMYYHVLDAMLKGRYQHSDPAGFSRSTRIWSASPRISGRRFTRLTATMRRHFKTYGKNPHRR